MEDPEAVAATLQDVVFMETVGMRPVLVHGGGKAIDRAMKASGLTPTKVAGRRYTDDATLKIVVDTLLNEINAGLVQQIRDLGGSAVALHTGGLQVLNGRKLAMADIAGNPIDLGRVGTVEGVNVDLITNTQIQLFNQLGWNNDAF